VRPPLTGSLRTARKVIGDVWRWFGLSGTPAAQQAPASPPAGEDAAARIDAARERLRATIRAPEDEHRE
jgi:hypothetical protein